MRAVIGCEFSGVVRRAFRALGIDAWSVDLLPAEDDSPHHIVGDVLQVLDKGWDLAIFHPPCTDLAVSGARHFAAKRADGRQQRALDFAQRLLDAPIEKIALENPVSIIATQIRPADQYVQPYWFGHPEFKKTGLWLKNLPKLTPTNLLTPPNKIADRDEWNAWNRVHREPPGVERWKNRSRTFTGIAAAMAEQWGRA